MFYILSKNEENYIIENIKHNKYKGNVMDDYPIRYCYKGWYNRYYDYYYKTHSEIYIEKVVEDYFKTIIWTKDYYFTGCPCWKHYYKYKGLLLSSINYYLQKNNINEIFFKETKPYTSSQQLMMILPPESNKLVEEKHRKLMTDIDSELIEFYPIEFQLEKMDKSRDWMYEPILPHFDEKILLKYV
jgi:5'-3' exoribonuclease 2